MMMGDQKMAKILQAEVLQQWGNNKNNGRMKAKSNKQGNK